MNAFKEGEFREKRTEGRPRGDTGKRGPQSSRGATPLKKAAAPRLTFGSEASRTEVRENSAVEATQSAAPSSVPWGTGALSIHTLKTPRSSGPLRTCGNAPFTPSASYYN